MSRSRGSLRHGAAITVGAILITAAISAVAIATVMYRTAFDRIAEAKTLAVTNNYEEKLRSIAQGWEEQLMREKTRLEFSRLLEKPEGRWDRLSAYLASLSNSPMYAGLTICDENGKPLFREGPRVRCHGAPDVQAGQAHAYVSDDSNRLFVELDTPIWLGPDGMGIMHLTIPLDHAFLWSSAFPDTELFIEWDGRILAGSAGEASLERGTPGFSGRIDRAKHRYEQRRLAFPRAGEPPLLVIQTHIQPPFSLVESVWMGIAVFAILSLLLAFGMRGWLARLLPRIESLSEAAHLYAENGKPTEALSSLLDQADGPREHDELSEVAHAMKQMVATLAEREQARRRDEERLRLADKVFRNCPQAILITDATSRIISVNPAFTEITGYHAEEAIGENPGKFSSGRHDAAFYAAMWAALKREGAWAGEVWDRRKNGAVYPKWLTISAVQNADTGEISHYVGIFSDITERKENEARIEHLAYHDALTGLPNRFALNARLAQSLADARRNNSQLAVMFIDLDRFKTINDSLGHDVGDQLLIAVAHRIKGVLRDSDTVARLGGDEFVIVVPGMAGPEDAARVAEKVIAEVGEPLVLSGHSLHTSPSIGIGIFPTDGGDADTLMKNADAAMYYAKQHGRNGYHFFTGNMNAAATERLLLETQMHHALDRHEFALVFQPQVEIATGKPVGVEALLRWHHPDRGTILPEKFIPIAEETGLIIPLGAWVLEEACRQAMTWTTAGLPPLRIAVNLSPHQLQDRHLILHVAETLARTGLPAERLELEIAEIAVMEHPEAAIEIVRSLTALGVRLAIDDFGAGYSSLAYLRRLPNSRLKVDRSFVMNLETDHNDMAITEGIIALGHSLGLNVTAEGIETPAQLSMLKGFGCIEGQGYLFSQPLTAEALHAFLASAPRTALCDASESAVAAPPGHHLH